MVVFTEYRDSLRAAARRLGQEGISFVAFHGATSDADRERALVSFNRDPLLKVFLATDAASEGKNFQHAAHHLIHLDVPWNPNRCEQRNGRIDRYGQDHPPRIWALVAVHRKRGEGRPEYRALELVVEKLRTIADQLGSVNSVLPGYASGSVRDVLLNADREAERRLEKLLDDPSLKGAEEDLSRLSIRNQHEMREAGTLVARLGTTDDFEKELGGLLRTAFRGWDDEGMLEALEPGLVRVKVPGRLRLRLGRAEIPRATFRRDRSQDRTKRSRSLRSSSRPATPRRGRAAGAARRGVGPHLSSPLRRRGRIAGGTRALVRHALRRGGRPYGRRDARSGRGLDGRGGQRGLRD